jgi:hypothetical protein
VLSWPKNWTIENESTHFAFALSLSLSLSLQLKIALHEFNSFGIKVISVLKHNTVKVWMWQ